MTIFLNILRYSKHAINLIINAKFVSFFDNKFVLKTILVKFKNFSTLVIKKLIIKSTHTNTDSVQPDNSYSSRIWEDTRHTFCSQETP